MISANDIADFIEANAVDESLAKKLVFVESDNSRPHIYQTLPATASQENVAGVLKRWHREGDMIVRTYIVRVSARNKVLSVREVRVSGWMEKQYQKRYENK
ncbi:MAG: hypothetical protein HYT16_00135 [DPANN group archaeon]|nr:hypothetical protein [DPANN group archaeon]